MRGQRLPKCTVVRDTTAGATPSVVAVATANVVSGLLLRCLLVTGVVFAGIVFVPTAVLASPDDPWPYVWPVQAPITDPFRAPASPYGPGNRGIEFATVPGQEVVSAGAGIVTFSGQVGGRLFVTVAHPDGVRTSYSFLRSIAVTKGQEVGRGETVGSAAAVFHVGARIGDAYVDPAILFGGAPSSPRLVARFDEQRPRGQSLSRGQQSSALFELGLAGATGLMRFVAEPVQSRTDTTSGV